MTELELIKQQPDGSFSLTNKIITTGEHWRSIAVMAFQKETMKLAIESLERHPKEDRNISTLTMTLSKSDIAEINDILKECRSALLKVAENSLKPEKVYQLNMQLFPVTV